MATYIRGVEDYVPSLEPFKPDYKFLSNVLDVRQDRYDTNFKQLNNLYNDVLNAPLSKKENIERRDQFANRLSNGLKQVSGMDLSLQQNADAAKGLFRPFFEDKDILFDMAYTKRYQKGMQDAQFFSTSPREKDQNRYWQYGVSKLNIDMDRFKEASLTDARKMSLPEYVENPNIYERAFDALKESGLNAKQTTPDGDWLITTTNGTALTERVTGYKLDKEGEIMEDADGNPIYNTTNTGLNWLSETLLRDPVIQRGLAVQAYVTAHNFYTNEENVQKYGTVDAAKQAWANQYIEDQTNQDKVTVAESTTAVKSAKTVIQRWDDYKKKHGIVPGSPEEEIMLQKIFEMQILKETGEMANNRIKKLAAPAINVDRLLDQGYQGFMKSIAGPLLKEAASAHSQIGAETIFKENQFALNEKQHVYNLQRDHERSLDVLDQIYARGDVALIKQADLYDRMAQLEMLKDQLTGGSGTGQYDMTPPTPGAFNMALQDQNVGDAQSVVMTQRNKDSRIWAETQINNQETALMKMMLETFPSEFVNSEMIKQNGGMIQYNYKQCATCPSQIKEASWEDAIKDLTLRDEVGLMLNEPEYERLKKILLDSPLSSLATKIENSEFNNVLMYTDIPSLNTKEGKLKEEEILTMHANIMQMKNLYTDLTDQKNQGYANLWKWSMQDTSTGFAQAAANGYVPGVLSQRQVAMIRDGVPMEIVYDSHNLETNNEQFLGGRYTKYLELNDTSKFVPSKELYRELNVHALANNTTSITNQNLSGHDAIKEYLDTNYNAAEYVGMRTGLYNPSGNRTIPLFENNPGLAKYWWWNADSTTGSLGAHLGGSNRGAWEFDMEGAMKDSNLHYDGSEDAKPNPEGMNVGGEDQGIYQILNEMLVSPDAVTQGYDVNFMGGWVGQPMLSRKGPGMGKVAFPSFNFTFDYLNQNAYTLQVLSELDKVVGSGTEGNDFFVSMGDKRGVSINQDILGENADEYSSRMQDTQDVILKAILQDYKRDYNWDKGDQPLFKIEYRQQGSKEGHASYHITLDKNYVKSGQWATLMSGFNDGKKKKTNTNLDKDQVDALAGQLISQGITVHVKPEIDNNPYHTKNRSVDAIASEIKRTKRPWTFPIANGGTIQVESTQGGYIIKSQKTKFENGAIVLGEWYTEPTIYDEWGLTDIIFRGIDDIQNNAIYQLDLKENPSTP